MKKIKDSETKGKQRGDINPERAKVAEFVRVAQDYAARAALAVEETTKAANAAQQAAQEAAAAARGEMVDLETVLKYVLEAVKCSQLACRSTNPGKPPVGPTGQKSKRKTR